jgi:hypothetical protein
MLSCQLALPVSLSPTARLLLDLFSALVPHTHTHNVTHAGNGVRCRAMSVGNSVLGRFGMNVDNFKAVKDPNTGSYSMSFQK